MYLWPLPSEATIREMFSQLYTTGDGSVPELRDYYGFCFDDAPDNPLVLRYEYWLDAVERMQPPGSLLDVGCGTGLFLAVARRRGWKVMGLDESEEATRHARNHFDLDVWVGDFTDLRATGQRFDVITGWDIIEHTRRPIDVLEEMRACLSRDGLVALSTPNQRSLLELAAGTLYRVSGGRVTPPLDRIYLDQHFLYFTPETLQGALKRAGFEVFAFAQEATDLRRLALDWYARAGLEALFALGRLTRRQNRMFLMARGRHGAPPA